MEPEPSTAAWQTNYPFKFCTAPKQPGKSHAKFTAAPGCCQTTIDGRRSLKHATQQAGNTDRRPINATRQSHAHSQAPHHSNSMILYTGKVAKAAPYTSNTLLGTPRHSNTLLRMHSCQAAGHDKHTLTQWLLAIVCALGSSRCV